VRGREREGEGEGEGEGEIGGVEKKALADIILSTIKDGSEQSNVV
jgi:hypothetical protein